MPASPAQPSAQSASSPPTWKRGEFHTFWAQMKIRVGGTGNQQVVDIQKGDEFEYDGSICRYAGAEFPQPSLRKAIMVGWATMDEEGDQPAPFVASRDIAVSRSKNTDLSRVQRTAHHSLETDSLDEETVLEVRDRQAAMDPRTRSGHLTSDHNRRQAGHTPGTFRGLEVSQSDLDNQDGRIVGKLRSSTHAKVDIIANPGAAKDIENSLDVANGYGRVHGAPRKGNRVVQREGVTITSNVGSMDRSAPVEYGDEASGEVVGRVRHSSARERSVEGVTVKDTSRSSQAPAPKAKAPAPAPKAKAPVLPDDASPKLKLAIRICPTFPVDWNFFAKADDKVKRIKSLKSPPELLDALYSVESTAMKKQLEKHFKSHFS